MEIKRFSGNACELVFIIEAPMARVTTVGYFDFPYNGAPLPVTFNSNIIEVDRVAPVGDGWFRVYIRQTSHEEADDFKETVDFHQEVLFNILLEMVREYWDDSDSHCQQFFFDGIFY